MIIDNDAKIMKVISIRIFIEMPHAQVTQVVIKQIMLNIKELKIIHNKNTNVNIIKMVRVIIQAQTNIIIIQVKMTENNRNMNKLIKQQISINIKDAKQIKMIVRKVTIIRADIIQHMITKNIIQTIMRVKNIIPTQRIKITLNISSVTNRNKQSINPIKVVAKQIQVVAMKNKDIIAKNIKRQNPKIVVIKQISVSIIKEIRRIIQIPKVQHTIGIIIL